MRENQDEHDEMITRIVDELRVLPAVPADATARVLARVDAARRGEGPSAHALADDDDVIFFPTNTEELRATPTAPGRPVLGGAPSDGSSAPGRIGRRFVLSLPAAIGYALAATLAGFLIRGAVPRQPGQGEIARASTRPETLGQRTAVVPAAVSRRDMQEAPVKVQLVLDARRAKSVAAVGDFNDWDKTASPLERDSTSGLWTTLVDVRPGRHVYAFLVDGSVWTLDPNAPRTKDSDYGTEQSVMIVGVR